MIGRVLLLTVLVADVASAQYLTGVMPRQPYRGEARAGFTYGGMQRSSATPGVAAVEATGTLTGAEVYARAANIGIYLRTLSGTQTATGQDLAGNLSIKEARLMIGEPALNLEGGVVRRTVASVAGDSSITLLRVGGRTQWEIGASGLQVTLGGGPRWVRFTEDGKASLAFVGFDAEAAVLYQLPRNLPIYAMLGWRYERFEDALSTSDRAEEGSGAFFGLGVRFAQRPVIR